MGDALCEDLLVTLFMNRTCFLRTGRTLNMNHLSNFTAGHGSGHRFSGLS